MNPTRPFTPVTLLLALAVLLTLAAGSATAAPKLGYVKVGKVSEPTSLSSPPGSPRLLFVTERTGRVKAVRPGKRKPRTVLDLSRATDPFRIERGLLGLAFAPDFRKSGRFYVNYTGRNGDSLVVEYRTRKSKPQRLVPGSRRLVLRIPRVNERGNHNGGHLGFHRNLLYISVGDGWDPGDLPDNAQNPESLRGKILRIDPRPDPVQGTPYRIPAGNPFVGVPGRDEVFALGFRNPHSFRFHRPPGGPVMIAIYDVGQNRFEELNYLPLAAARGANFGWNDHEGFEPYNCGELCPDGADPLLWSGLAWPQLVYSHEDGCAIIGGPVISDQRLDPFFRGRLIFGDFCANRVRTARPANPTITDDRPPGFYLPPGKNGHPALNGFGTDGLGRVYAFTHRGPIYRLVQR